MTDKISEYQMIAALICYDIDTYAEIVESNPDIAAGIVRKLKEQKDLLISDKNFLRTRYVASCNLFQLFQSVEDK